MCCRGTFILKDFVSMLNLFYYDFGVRLIKPDPNIYYRTDFPCALLFGITNWSLSGWCKTVSLRGGVADVAIPRSKRTTKRCARGRFSLVTGGSPHHPAGWFGMTPFILWLLQQPDKLKFETLSHRKRRPFLWKPVDYFMKTAICANFLPP